MRRANPAPGKKGLCRGLTLTACLSPPPPRLQTQLIQMVVWMLQHRLLIQLHTYVCLMVPPKEEDVRPKAEEVAFTARLGGRSLSTPNALSFGSPSRKGLLWAPAGKGRGGGGGVGLAARGRGGSGWLLGLARQSESVEGPEGALLALRPWGAEPRVGDLFF